MTNCTWATKMSPYSKTHFTDSNRQENFWYPSIHLYTCYAEKNIAWKKFNSNLDSKWVNVDSHHLLTYSKTTLLNILCKHIFLTEIFLILKRIQTPQPVPILQLDAWSQSPTLCFDLWTWASMVLFSIIITSSYPEFIIFYFQLTY